MQGQTCVAGNKITLNENKFRRDHYTFNGWNTKKDGSGVSYGNKQENVEPTGDLTLYAQWKGVEYEIVFKYDTGEVIDVLDVEYGKMPVIADPEMESDELYDYTFSGWEPELTEVKGPAVYKATFTVSDRKYRITFERDDGAVIKVKEFKYGDYPSFDGEPTKDPTDEYTYTFSEWDPSLRAVTGPATYKASFTAAKRSYEVSFIDDDGKVLKAATEYEYGTPAADIAKPDDPADKVTAEFTYRFAGWSPEIAEVTGAATYTATYTAIRNKYAVTFVDDDGTVLKAATKYEYGTPAASIVKPDDPADKVTPEFTYNFAGWSPEIADVTGAAT